MVTEMVTEDDIFEAGRKICQLLDGIDVSFTENGFVLREKGADPLFSRRVDASMEEWGADGKFAAVGFYGEHGDGAHSPAVVSLLPESRHELEAFLRFAVGAAFNMELRAGFMEG